MPKGKTTAALGQGLRASGHGFKVFMIQFLKGNNQSGEIKAVYNTPDFEIKQFGTLGIIDVPGERDIEQAKNALDFAEDLIKHNDYDILILDEVGVALEMAIIDVEDVLKLIDIKPPDMELILTGGTKIHPKIEAKADLITEMRMIKHYYSSQGLKARFGIEY